MFWRTGLAGHTNLEQAKADMIVECVADMMNPIQPAYREKNEEKKVSHVTMLSCLCT